MNTADHELIIDSAFGDLGFADRKTLKRASRDSDGVLNGGQAPQNSYKHWMRAEGQPAQEADNLARSWIRQCLLQAVSLKRGNSQEAALYQLGLGMHTIADSFSPAHAGVQAWCGLSISCIPSDIYHVRHEHARTTPMVKREAAKAIRDYYDQYTDSVSLTFNRPHVFY
jgi:hypothetical protein